jgi:hypothetical protein
MSRIVRNQNITTYSPSRGQPDCQSGRLLNRPWPSTGEAIKTRPRPEPAALDDPEPACCRNRIPLICPGPAARHRHRASIAPYRPGHERGATLDTVARLLHPCVYVYINTQRGAVFGSRVVETCLRQRWALLDEPVADLAQGKVTQLCERPCRTWFGRRIA